MTEFETIVSTRRSFLATSAAAGAIGLLGLAEPTDARAASSQPENKGSSSANEDSSIRPYRINVPQADLVDLRRRIAATRWPEKETVSDVTQGVQLATMRKLVVSHKPCHEAI